MVYLLKAEEANYAKIGFTTTDVQIRLQGIQTGFPFKLQYVDSVEGSKRLEKYLHLKCEKFKKTNEWFFYSEELKAVWDKEKNATDEEITKFFEKRGTPLKVNVKKGFQRVDVDFNKETLQWAGEQAAKLGVSRRRFLRRLLYKVWDAMQQSPHMNIKDIVNHSY